MNIYIEINTWPSP